MPKGITKPGKIRFNQYSVEQTMDRFNISKEESIERIRLIKENMNAYSISTQMKRYGISKEEAEEKIRLIKQSNSSTLESKIRKGMDPEEAQQKVTEEKRKNSENTIKGQQKFKEENLKGWKAMSRSNPEYWIIHKKLPNEEAILRANKHIFEMQKSFQEQKKENHSKYKSSYLMNQEYWLKRGFSQEEAIEKSKERQKTFTLEKCVEKYGEENGTTIWKNRNSDWSFKVESLYKEGKFNRFSGNASIPEKELTLNIINNFPNDKIYHGKNQYFISLKSNDLKRKIFFYDIVFKEKMKIIEFNGDFWHFNPAKYQENDIHPMMKITGKEIWEHDKRKKNAALGKGFKYLIIWESEYKTNPKQVINQCINFLNS